MPQDGDHAASSTIRRCAAPIRTGCAGLGPPARKSVAPPVDDDIDRLADHVEAHLDAPLLGRILRLQPLQPSARSTFHVTR